MQKRTISNASRMYLMLLLAVVLAVPFAGVAQARQGQDDGQETHTSSSHDSADSESSDDSSSHNSGEVRQKVAELKDRTKKTLEAKKENRSVLTEAQKQKVCENREKAINNKMTAFKQAANKHLAKYDALYVKVLAYQKDKNVDVAELDALTASIDTKKQTATTAVAALDQVAIDIDCTSAERAASLSTARDAAKSARNALHEYRISLKKLIVAIVQAQKANNAEDDR